MVFELSVCPAVLWLLNLDCLILEWSVRLLHRLTRLLVLQQRLYSNLNTWMLAEWTDVHLGAKKTTNLQRSKTYHKGNSFLVMLKLVTGEKILLHGYQQHGSNFVCIYLLCLMFMLCVPPVKETCMYNTGLKKLIVFSLRAYFLSPPPLKQVYMTTKSQTCMSSKMQHWPLRQIALPFLLLSNKKRPSHSPLLCCALPHLQIYPNFSWENTTKTFKSGLCTCNWAKGGVYGWSTLPLFKRIIKLLLYNRLKLVFWRFNIFLLSTFGLHEKKSFLFLYFEKKWIFAKIKLIWQK